MELAELPEQLVIVGGGYIGLEFASMYASFGSQVTVLEGYSELICPRGPGHCRQRPGPYWNRKESYSRLNAQRAVRERRC